MPKPIIPLIALGILATLVGLVWGKGIPSKCDLYGKIQLVDEFRVHAGTQVALGLSSNIAGDGRYLLRGDVIF